MKWYNDFDTKEDFLWYLYNKLGCYDLKLCFSFIDNKGDLQFSKHIKYGDLLTLNPDDRIPGKNYTKKWFIDKVSHRSVLDIELMFDIDDKDDFNSIYDKATHICTKLKLNNIDYVCYFTGSKSYHISCLFPEFRNNPKLKQEVMIKIFDLYKTDMQLKTGHMIALEGMIHYKSNQEKVKVKLI